MTLCATWTLWMMNYCCNCLDMRLDSHAMDIHNIAYNIYNTPRRYITFLLFHSCFMIKWNVVNNILHNFSYAMDHFLKREHDMSPWTMQIRMWIKTYLFGDQVTSLFNEIKQGIDITWPIIQNLVSVLLDLEWNDTSGSIHSCIDCLWHHQFRQETLCISFAQIKQLHKTFGGDTCIIFGDNANVVFNHAVMQFFPSFDTIVACFAEHSCLAECFTIQFLNLWPSHQFTCHKALCKFSIHVVSISPTHTHVMQVLTDTRESEKGWDLHKNDARDQIAHYHKATRPRKE